MGRVPPPEPCMCSAGLPLKGTNTNTLLQHLHATSTLPGNLLSPLISPDARPTLSGMEWGGAGNMQSGSPNAYTGPDRELCFSINSDSYCSHTAAHTDLGCFMVRPALIQIGENILNFRTEIHIHIN